ncbi:putative siderophore transport system permease protein YfhA [Corynebacterium kalinowskii]|uniref:Siderophore transport system permease protein YfhA n=1 Tax=Corynebacterium kalinowskii TaxID=2675216 RepID=A0A6B8VR68_9CORY|nr:iron ABC transporter permease [Corynebacterium kalinowskii]QGU01515.1 putative siderophore transport system permease protein YfhA [Corynebacterium kalinowskii]
MIRVSLVGILAYFALLCLGAVPLAPLDVLAALTGGGSARAVQVVWDLRLPVAIVTAVVGASLATAGAWTSTLARNPLASPDMLGISGGAAVAVVAFPVSSFWERAGLALVGAVVCLLLLLVLGARRSVHQLILIGVALALFSQAAVSYLLLRADLMRATEAQVWLAGSTSFARWPVVVPLLLGLLPFLVLGLSQQRSLPILAHDDATAISLGVPVTRVRLLLVIAATGIVAVVVSVVGPLAFVALVAPQLARMMGGGVLLSAIWGATLLLVCAVVAVLLPVSAPVGLLTSAIGGVMLVYLVVSRRSSWSS